MGVRPVGVSIGSLSKFFPQQEIEAILRASGREGHRRRKLPALDLVYYVIALGSPRLLIAIASRAFKISSVSTLANTASSPRIAMSGSASSKMK